MKKQDHPAGQKKTKEVVTRLVKAVRPKISVRRANGPFPVIAQDRPTSRDFSMPETAIKTGEVDYILPLDGIAAKLIELVADGRSPSQGRTTGKRNPTVVRGNSPRPSYAAGTKAAMVKRKK